MAGLRVFVDRAEALASVAGLLDRVLAEAVPVRGRRAKGGPVTLLLMDPSLPGEVEIDAGGEWPVTPQVRRALRSLPGVVEVEEV